MSPEVERLFTKAIKLPEDERAALAAVLVDSLGDGLPEEELEAAWTAETHRRDAAVHSGGTEIIPSEDVERELEEIVSRAYESRRTDG